MRTARPEPTGFAAKAKDLQALRDAVDQAATVSGALWLSYIFVFLYLAIAAGAVTHKDLFFENPVKLPFLNVELPLIAFFTLGPLLFLIVHAYTLLHFAMLAGKVGAFHAELEVTIPLRVDREDLRRQLPSNIFVQFLAGPRGVRTGVFGLMLRLIAWISLIIGPVALLVFFELQFLPYHDPVVTWWHRVAVFIDLILLWILWPRVAPIKATSALGRSYYVGLRIIGLTGLSLLSLVLVTTATFRGEWLHNVFNVPPGPLHQFLVGGEVDDVAQRQKSWWSNRLVVPGIDLREHTKFDTKEKIESRTTTLRLRKRHFEDAILENAYLPKADLTGAELRRARMRSTQLPGASLHGAQLQEARLDLAPLERAQLQDASLFLAQLKGARLDGAQLQGATLVSANMQGARLDEAELQGATLVGAQLHGASLAMAQLQGASLDGAELQGALLDLTQLQGASLREAQLQDASLFGAQPQGASLAVVSLQRAFLFRTFVWRADAAGMNLQKA
ncbi:MAG: pentapeptide repeat-containing protein, partial [Alphaproteobacteria bacterium]